LLHILEDNREIFLEKEVQTFLSNFGGSSFLNKVSVKENQKNKFKLDFEIPIIKSTNKLDKNFKCIICDNIAKRDTIFNTGLISYLGLNKDSLNFVWKFNPKIPLCEICELVYFCAWAGYTRGFENKTYLFINDDSNVQNLIEKNNLLKNLLKKDLNKENILTIYFYELLLREEKELSKFRLQNLHIIEINLSNSTFPKIYSFHISRIQAEFIRNNSENLKKIAPKRYKIKDVTLSLIYEFLNLFFERKLTYNYLSKLLKFYIQTKEKESSNISVYFKIYDLQIINLLTFEYLLNIKQLKSINMETKQIWTIYHYGFELKQILRSKNADNKINSIAYRLLKAVRSGDKNTFMNLLLRLYIAYDQAVPVILTKILESKDNFEVIGYSYINGLLEESLNKEKTE
jgi:CRISPR-associated protein Cst1